MAGVGLRGLARALELSPSYVHKLKEQGVITAGADGTFDIAAVRATLEARRSVAHAGGHLAELNVRQRRGRLPRGAPLSGSAPAPSGGGGQAPGADDLPPHVPAGDAPLPGTSDAAKTRRQFDQARTAREGFTARLAQLAWQQKSGSLVDRGLAERVLFQAARDAREAWLSFPARVAPLIAAVLGLPESDALQTALTEHVREQIATLGEPAPDFDTGGAVH